MCNYPPGNTGSRKQAERWIRSSCILLLLSCSYFTSIAQEIVVDAHQQALNELIYDLIEEHHLLLSFNDRALSRESVSLQGSYNTADVALEAILSGTAFDYSKQGEIYVILERSRPSYLISGWVGDLLSGESLPYAHIIVNGTGLVTDQQGRFLVETGEEECSVKVSHLGYFVHDTILYTGMHTLFLTPSVHGLEEITIEGEKVERSMEIADAPGQIRLNQKTARKIPGNGDNSVYNFLRLQPGILAAGEQSSDLIIWGAYEGHSKVIFDGFTVYGLKNFNDNISAVNPYMTKDMLVLKGGYGAEYGDRVGGIVDITGITGNKFSPSINLNINNMTMNGMASVPVHSRAALTIAFRRTYFNLYNPEDLSVPLIGNSRSSETDISVVPDYTFGDFNLKYAGNSDKLGSYYLSFYNGSDNFSYDLEQARENVMLEQEAAESNKQMGGALQWSRDIFGRLSTDMTFSFSDLNGDVELLQNVYRLNNSANVFTRNKTSGNRVSEAGWLNRYYYTGGINNRYQLQAGVGYTFNRIILNSQVNQEDQLNDLSSTGRMTGYITNSLNAANSIRFTTGVRFDVPFQISKVYAQPRLTIQLFPEEKVSTYVSWGIYNQFILKTSVLDDYGNYQYFWAIADNIDVPVLQSYHYVGGLKYHDQGFTFSAETYYKSTNGLSRYVNLLRLNQIALFPGDSRSYGADFLVKASLKKHEAWISYSLSKTLEYFTYFPDDSYFYAPQDQRHEIKASMLLDFSPVHFSANYVYGSGLIMRRNQFTAADPVRAPYKRLDMALFYSISLRNYTFELGASILNVFNTENIKISNFVRVPSEQLSSVNIHAEAVPFTPTIFLNMAF